MTTPVINVLASVDDNADDQFLYKRLVKRERLANTFLTFASGPEALDYLSEHGPDSIDAIMLDLNMPRMNGFEFIEAATEAHGEKLSPIFVMLTSSLNPEDEAKARSMDQIKKFYKKPLTVEVLHEMAAAI